MQNEFSILMVCTGNICRSPMAENLLAKMVQDISEVRIMSAGTHAMVGEPMFPISQQIAQSYGAEDLESHRARQVTDELLKASDLVLTMTREQRRFVVESNPHVTRRAFTLREFSRLASVTTDEMLAADLETIKDFNVDKLRTAVQSVSLSRSQVSPVSEPAELEVIDPYGQPAAVHQDSAEQLVPAIESVADLIRRALIVTKT
ncbi:arsenate reductase/protein-tyrosine-phosphatase family protein [Corynebacterium ammoniagenes]|uniref:Low molecular weight phosphatase family protein n=1 Tax=Corynebacterium ammoniagenes TaxID=1697 RepID=A0AAV5G4C4_CORAM|nr:low molecular weight phosphatase family protein [Corynebacterium ammoniagenes]GJN41996.1 low molecular weight phosphatase family protein [Corynebacterium ammoniagenes]